MIGCREMIHSRDTHMGKGMSLSRTEKASLGSALCSTFFLTVFGFLEAWGLGTRPCLTLRNWLGFWSAVKTCLLWVCLQHLSWHCVRQALEFHQIGDICTFWSPVSSSSWHIRTNGRLQLHSILCVLCFDTHLTIPFKARTSGKVEVSKYGADWNI